MTFKIVLVKSMVKDGASSSLKNKYMCNATFPKAVTGNAIIECIDEIDI